MATSPQFIGTPRLTTATSSAANTATDGTGTIVSVITGAASGTRVLEVIVKCAATSAAAQVNLFLSSDGGTTWRIFDSVTVTAVTQSATVGGFEASAVYANLILPSTSHVLGFTTTVAQATNVIALGGDF